MGGAATRVVLSSSSFFSSLGAAAAAVSGALRGRRVSDAAVDRSPGGISAMGGRGGDETCATGALLLQATASGTVARARTRERAANFLMGISVLSSDVPAANLFSPRSIFFAARRGSIGARSV
jgi:hypothetical protein